MRIGVITDIHNQAIALKAVLEKFQQASCDRVIFCGDSIGIGPYPEQTVQLLKTVPNLVAVRGNHERYLLEGMPSTVPNEEQMSMEEMHHHHWEHSLLSTDSIAFLKSWPDQTVLHLCGKTITVLHYAMDTSDQYRGITSLPDEKACRQVFAGIESDVVLFGHDHKRTVCQTKDRLFLNVGSLGCPGKDKNIARGGILTITEDVISMDFIDIVYNVEQALRDMDRLAYPAVDQIKHFFYGV